MMDFLNNIVSDVNGFLWTYVIITLLVVAGFYFTFRLRFVQIRHFILTWRTPLIELKFTLYV